MGVPTNRARAASHALRFRNRLMGAATQSRGSVAQLLDDGAPFVLMSRITLNTSP
jgi:hypothetical protein